MNVTVISSSIQNLAAEKGESLLSALRRGGYSLSADCGGVGKCGKCMVALVDEKGDERMVKSCNFTIEKDITVKVNPEQNKHLGIQTNKIGSPNAKHSKIDAALDIGTTTIAYSLFSGGQKVFEGGFLNPQKPYGADVISRINASKECFSELVSAIRKGVERELSRAMASIGASEVGRLYVVGNTAMLHIFKAESPMSIGEYPYTPQFLTEQVLAGKDVELPFIQEVILAPGFSSFVGGDITAGAIAVDMQNGDMLVDIGTNGEVLFKKGDIYYCTSAAAGPAFEGGNIECGMGGTAGGINRVLSENGKIVAKTIGNAPPVGITGSGLTDALAIMLGQGRILPTGAIADVESDAERIYITDSVYISQKDIRAFQLAKSALRSAVDLLLESAEASGSNVKNLYIAGGLGCNINVQSALALGLFPKELAGKVRLAGNTALRGAEACLNSEECRARAKDICKSPRVLELSDSPDFFNHYIKNIPFFE